MSSRILVRFFIKTNFTRYYSRAPATMKLDTPEFAGIFSPPLKSLISLFEKYDYEIRIAGGAVRDLLLGISPKDIDFATTATPTEMKEMFTKEEIRMINTKGEKHGTITARIENENFEVTTLRIDKITDGRHAEVEFTKDWELDANRRDLTINSMFLGVDGTVYDYFNGAEDLKRRRVAFVGDADIRIKEDYLRILRYFRFYGRVSETPDQHETETLNIITANIEGLQKITGERIWQELSKILSGNYASHLLRRLIQCNAAPHIGFPENPQLGELVSVYEKSKSLEMHPVTVLVSIMNDNKDFEKFHARCKLSGFERDLGFFLIENRHSNDISLKRFQKYILTTDLKLNDASRYVKELCKYNTDLKLLHEFQSWTPPIFPVKGNDLIDAGIPRSKVFGLILKQIKDIWITSDFKLSKDELVTMIPKVAEEIYSKRKKP